MNDFSISKSQQTGKVALNRISMSRKSLEIWILGSDETTSQETKSLSGGKSEKGRQSVDKDGLFSSLETTMGQLKKNIWLKILSQSTESMMVLGGSSGNCFLVLVYCKPRYSLNSVILIIFEIQLEYSQDLTPHALHKTR